MRGDFASVGAPLFRVHGEPEGLSSEEVARLVVLGRERMHESDPAFGFRKLVDIAERSIAQPFDDPTTAVQAIHLITRTISWDGYVRLAFDELRLVGASQPQVARRLQAALEDLKTVAPPERQPALDRQLELLEALVREQLNEEKDIRASLTADQQGIGSGQDVIATDGRSDDPDSVPRTAALP